MKEVRGLAGRRCVKEPVSGRMALIKNVKRRPTPASVITGTLRITVTLILKKTSGSSVINYQ
jgi:hypothetical protein